MLLDATRKGITVRSVHVLRLTSRLLGLLVATAQVGCGFEPDIAPLEMATPAPQPFGGALPAEAEGEESPEAAMERLLDELFDPYNLPWGSYEGSVYQVADRILAGAYAYYGYDLAELAANRQDNPLTEEMFRDYLEAVDALWIADPATGDDFNVYAWLVVDLAVDGPEAVHSMVLQRIGQVDENNWMNYERNYLNALFTAYSEEVLGARIWLVNSLFEVYGNDAAAIYDYLLSLDLMGTE